MATIQSQLVCDSSTVANFKAWSQGISNALSTFGLTKSSDTGQVNWSNIAAVPGAGSYVYEIWQPADGLTNYYLKVEYGNTSANSNNPTIRVSVSTGTNGSGTLTGFIAGPFNTAASNITPPSTSTQFECDFSGDNGSRFAAMMWRNSTSASNVQQFFAIERSIGSNGAYTGDYVTLYFGGYCGGNPPNACPWGQQTLVFEKGAAPATANNGARQSNGNGGLQVRAFNYQTTSSSAFANSVGMDTAAPYIGYFDRQGTVVGAAYGADYTEGVTFTATVWGSARTYMPSKNGMFQYAGPNNGGNAILCMRYD